MIRHIVAIDSSRGFAKLSPAGEVRTPWRLPGDMQYYYDHIRGQRLLMGRMTYEAIHADDGAYNYVLTHSATMPVQNGEAVGSIDEALAKNGGRDLWVIGGVDVYAGTIALANELYITRVEGDFDCDRFYPEIPSFFVRSSVSAPRHENGQAFFFEIYKRNR